MTDKVHLRLRAGRPFIDAQVLDGPRSASEAIPRVQAEAYTAGSKGHPDMRRWDPRSGSADSDFLPEQKTIRARSRDLHRNHGVAEGVLQTYNDNIVGTGLRMKSRPHWKALLAAGVNFLPTEEKAEEWSNFVEARWWAHASSHYFDVACEQSFDAQTTQVMKSGAANGEAVALPIWLPEPGALAATRMQLIEPDRLCNPMGTPERDGFRGGRETDFYGKVLNYYIMKRHPGDSFLAANWSPFAIGWNEWEKIPATTPWGRKRVIHLYDKERIGSSRGKPSVTSVLRQFKVLGDYSNAELAAAVRNARVALVTEGIFTQEQLLELLDTNVDVKEKYIEGIATRGKSSIGLEDGTLVPLGFGEKLASFSPARPSTAFEAFTLALFRQIAAGLNIPYELLLKDFSKTNYSSARAALLEAWRFFRGRRKWIVGGWCQPVFELWFEEEVMTGRIEAPQFYDLRAYYCRTKWIGDGRGWVDPLKEAQALEVRLRNGVSTFEDECAEQGGDWEENIETTARIVKRAAAAGVTFSWMPGAKPNADTVIQSSQHQQEPQPQPAA